MKTRKKRAGSVYLSSETEKKKKERLIFESLQQKNGKKILRMLCDWEGKLRIERVT